VLDRPDASTRAALGHIRRRWRGGREDIVGYTLLRPVYPALAASQHTAQGSCHPEWRPQPERRVSGSSGGEILR